MALSVGSPSFAQQRLNRPQRSPVQAGGQDVARLAPDLVQYRRAVANLQSKVDADLKLQTTPGPDGLKLAANMQPLFMVQPTPNAKGTVVLYHGYTAGPWQYPEMAERFYKAGYNVYAPRMPGHGFIKPDGKPTGEKLPTTEAEYERFIDQQYKDVKALGAPVYVAGLSGGGNIAMRMAEKYPDIKGAVLFSPYLGASGLKGGLFDFLNAADRWTDGWVGKELRHVPAGVNKPEPVTAHTEGNLSQALAMNEVGRRVQRIPCPAQIMQTEGDFLSGATHVKVLLDRSDPGRQKDGWYMFPKAEGVPHAMVSGLENHHPEAVQRISDMAFEFIDRGRVTNR